MSGQPCKNVKQPAGVGTFLWESRNKLLQKWSLKLSAPGVQYKCYNKFWLPFIMSIHHLWRNLTTTTTDMQDSLNLLTQFQNMMLCFLINVQLLRTYDQGMFIFGVTKTKFLPRTGTQFALHYDMDISINNAYYWSIMSPKVERTDILIQQCWDQCCNQTKVRWWYSASQRDTASLNLPGATIVYLIFSTPNGSMASEILCKYM